MGHVTAYILLNDIKEPKLLKFLMGNVFSIARDPVPILKWEKMGRIVRKRVRERSQVVLDGHLPSSDNATRVASLGLLMLTRKGPASALTYKKTK